ncbi:MAG: MBL fold metallo-hydrolase [Motiliproteus sp.]
MLFRQLFEPQSSAFSYLIADAVGGKAMLIDPVLDKMELYQQLLDELQLQLMYAIDTHVHADHITALAALRQRYGCETVHGEHSKAQGISRRVADGEWLMLDRLKLKALYTPGHTDDSYSFLLNATPADLLFSGDTLLIRSTGRTDFQHGDASAQYHSLFNKLLRLDDETRLLPGHDYQGMTSSTIGEEKRHNPRLQVNSEQQYLDLMATVRLDPPRQIDVAVPANLNGGRLS